MKDMKKDYLTVGDVRKLLTGVSDDVLITIGYPENDLISPVSKYAVYNEITDKYEDRTIELKTAKDPDDKNPIEFKVMLINFLFQDQEETLIQLD